nr:MAG TPA: hypothetical protein [Caudoviricetes sp.]
MTSTGILQRIGIRIINLLVVVAPQNRRSSALKSLWG